jgi:hypothetical protein
MGEKAYNVVVTVPRRVRAVNGWDCVRADTSEALDGLPDHGCRERFIESWHTGVFEKRLRFGAESIAGQKYNTLTEVGMTALQLLVEAWAVQLGHPQVAEQQFNWLRVSDTAERSQVDQRIGHQLHAIVSLLDTFKS